MMRNLKALGLALVAVFAMSALAASGASAASFTAGEADTTISGVQKTTHVFAVTGVETSCKKVSFSGTSSSVVQASITITPKYEECTAESIIGTINVTVTGFGAGECDYRINASGTADLECASGKEVTVDASTCTIHVPAQTGLSKLKFTNEGSGSSADVRVDVELEKITTNHTDGFGCPLTSGGESATGTLNGDTTVTGSGAGGSVAISWDA